VGRVGIDLADLAIIRHGADIVLGVELTFSEAHHELARGVVGRVIAEEKRVRLPLLVLHAQLAVALADAAHLVARLFHQFGVGRKAFGKVGRHGLGHQRGFRILVGGLDIADGEVAQGRHRLRGLRKLVEHQQVLLDRLLELVLAEDQPRAGELHLAHLAHLLLGHRRAQVGVVASLDELAQDLGALAGLGGPLALRETDEDVDEVVEGAVLLALAGLGILLADQQVLDALLVGLVLLGFGHRLVHQQHRQQVAALRHGAHAQHTLRAVRVLLPQRIVDGLELRHVVFNQLLRTLEVAAHQEEVRLHHDRLAEPDVLLPEQLVDIGLGLFAHLVLVLFLLDIGQEFDHQFGHIGAHLPLDLFLQRHLEKVAEGRERLAVFAQIKQHLRILISRVAVKGDPRARRLLDFLEEGQIEFVRVGILAEGIVGVGLGQRQRPELNPVFIGDRVDHLLDLVKTPLGEQSLGLADLELGRRLRKTLLGLGDHLVGNVRHTQLLQQLDVTQLHMQRLVFGRGLRERAAQRDDHTQQPDKPAAKNLGVLLIHSRG